ncbi:MAG: hypothetical protein JRI23_14045 [Deltaproteobacteria bacterium]|jgi:hypothetical protein|nr:hypothetical protein [Deltaproteobacteria bacterium]MBW2532852.1 hypothetical protein [Deltaproteobacteria bacterium]
MTRRWPALAVATLISAGTVEARADAAPKFGNGFWLPVGVTLGGAFRGDLPDGFMLGAEVSAVYLWAEGDAGGMWLGGVADAVWDFGIDAFRHRVGPEIGWGPLGVDVTYLGQARDGVYDPGINVRGLFTLAVVSLYGGYGHLFVDGDGGSYGEFGALVKFPIPIDVDSRSDRFRDPPPPPEPEPSNVPLRPLPTDEPGATPPGEPTPAGPLQPVDVAPAHPEQSPYATPPPPPPPPSPPPPEPDPSPYDPSGD